MSHGLVTLILIHLHVDEKRGFRFGGGGYFKGLLHQFPLRPRPLHGSAHIWVGDILRFVQTWKDYLIHLV